MSNLIMPPLQSGGHLQHQNKSRGPETPSPLLSSIANQRSPTFGSLTKNNKIYDTIQKL